VLLKIKLHFWLGIMIDIDDRPSIIPPRRQGLMGSSQAELRPCFLGNECYPPTRRYRFSCPCSGIPLSAAPVDSSSPLEKGPQYGYPTCNSPSPCLEFCASPEAMGINGGMFLSLQTPRRKYKPPSHTGFRGNNYSSWGHGQALAKELKKLGDSLTCIHCIVAHSMEHVLYSDINTTKDRLSSLA